MYFDATFAGITFRGRPDDVDLVNEFVVLRGGLEGWSGNVNVRRPQIERPYGHGSFPATPLYADRLITMNGVVTGSTERQLTNLTQKLSGMRLGYQEFAVTEHGQTLRARACLQQVTINLDQVQKRRARFRVILWCPEPWKIGADNHVSRTGSGSVKVMHYGTVDAAPFVRVTGPVTSDKSVLQAGGREFALLGKVAAGEVKTIDMLDGVVTSSRYGRQQGYVFGELLRIPPGIETTVKITSTGDGKWEFFTPDTYV